MTFIRFNWAVGARALIFALAWLYLPLWAFILLALWCYFTPLFNAGRFFTPFLVLMAIVLAEAPSAVMAVILALIFYYLLLIKDLLVIDRATAHELLTILLSFFLFRVFFFNLSHGPTGAALAWAFLAALLWSMLLNNLIVSLVVFKDGHQGVRRIIDWISFLLMAEALTVVLFLPLNFIYQSILVFLVAILFIELLPDHISGVLQPSKIRLTGTVVFTLTVIVLAAAKWGI
ncbi:MAG: hypothetical protein KGJ13_03150 [Patescibacteria group bacterium]|nr:hypothetical protein [Patescibacteria group bacterium]